MFAIKFLQIFDDVCKSGGITPQIESFVSYCCHRSVSRSVYDYHSISPQCYHSGQKLRPQESPHAWLLSTLQGKNINFSPTPKIFPYHLSIFLTSQTFSQHACLSFSCRTTVNFVGMTETTSQLGQHTPPK